MMNLLPVLFVILGICAANAKAEVCNYWLARVDSNTEVDYEIEEENPKKILEGINCLLRLEGNKSEGLFSGATNFNVSEIFPPATVEICALYYISYLFNSDWTHANGIALYRKNGEINSDKSVRKAFVSYRRWFKKVKQLGLNEARKQKLNPLAGSGISWY